MDSKQQYSGSRSQRVFAATPGEQDTNGNFYCGTYLTSPPPGTYNEIESLKLSQCYRVKTSPFSSTTSNRVLSQSRHVWTAKELQHVTPAPFAYDIRPSTTQELVKLKICSSNRELKILNERLTSEKAMNTSSLKLTEEEILQERRKLKDLRLLLQAEIEDKDRHTRKTKNNATKSAFASSEIRYMNKPNVAIETPHFYRGDVDKTFGFDSRSKTPDMSAFNYTNKVKQEVLVEKHSNIDILTGIKSPASRCKDTHFFCDVSNALIKDRLPTSTIKSIHTKRMFAPNLHIS